MKRNKTWKVFGFFLALVVVLAGAALPAQAANLTLDETTCTSLGGSWDGSNISNLICSGITHIEAGDTLTIPFGTSLRIDAGSALTNDGVISLGGRLNIYGTLTNNGTITQTYGSAGTFTNNGTLTNNGTMTIRIIANYSDGTVTNDGTIINTAEIWNTGVFNNYGTINNNTYGAIYNYYGQNSNGTLYYGTFNNAGTIYNGVIHNYGAFWSVCSGAMQNVSFVNHDNGSMGGYCDVSDSDGDGVNDDQDAFPLDPTRAVSCNPGYYGAFTCEAAQPGQYVATSEALAPSLCPVGTFSDVAAATECQSAAPGSYVAIEGATASTVCPVGYYQPYSGSTSCIAADPGYYVATSGSTAQTICTVGTFSSVAGSTSCTPAAPGSFVAIEGATTSTACPVGYYQPSSGSTSCIAAAPGYYVDTTGATAQIMCPTGYTSTAGASACTPEIVYFNFSGFFQPVDNAPTINQVKAGQGVPFKFSLNGNQGLNILASGSPVSANMACDGSAPVDVIETVTSGNSGLSYDAATDTYTYVWKTNKSWANTCRQFKITLTDGTVHVANFKFK